MTTMARHSILSRQLIRCFLNESQLPQSLEQWHQFLDRIDRAYNDFDEERYLTERTYEISSREMQGLYQKLTETQIIARLSGWSYDCKTQKFHIPRGVFRAIGIETETSLFDYEKILEQIYLDDRNKLEKHIQTSIQQGLSFEIEIRVELLSQIRWIHIIGKPIRNEKDNLVEKINGTVMDVTTRKLSELREEMEHSILRLLVQVDSLEAVIQPILKIIAETYNFELGVFWRWNAKRHILKREAIWGGNSTIIKTYLETIISDTYTSDAHFIIRNVLEKQSAYWLDVFKEKIPKEYNTLFKKLNIHSAFAFPVQVKNVPIFVLDFLSKNNKELDQNDLQSINLLSKQLGLYIQKKYAQEKEKELNLKLVATARRAGMAEVATSVLHNVGNVLNSINVSASLLREKLMNPKILNSIAKLNNLIKKHQNNLAGYITEDPQGKNIPVFLTEFEQVLKDEKVNSLKEINSLTNNIQHVRDIIMMQQSLGGVIGVLEPISIHKLIDEAIIIVGFDSAYTIERHYEDNKMTILDKVKLLQILVNLIRNAKDALNDNQPKEKKLTLITKQKSNDTIEIKVIDNGIGIDNKNLIPIFSFGFTTKKTGHGFGLHTSAMLIKEMGGTIKAESKGNGKGAIFTLELPYKTLATGEQQ